VVWKDCGYISLTKSGRGVTVMVKHTLYYVKLEELKSVLDGKVKCTLVYEPSLTAYVEPEDIPTKAEVKQ
jgi:hypothetical protein